MESVSKYILYVVVLVIIIYTIDTMGTMGTIDKLTKETMDNIDIPVFLVSLEKDYKRRDELYKQVTPDAYYGVHGESLNKELLIKKGILDKNADPDLKKGHIGCYISHMTLLNEIAMTDHKYALIIEDDADFDKQKMNNILSDIMRDLPEDFDILFLGHRYHEEPDMKIHKSIKDYNLKKVKLIWASHCYLVNVNNIRDKLDKFYPMKKPIDLTLPVYTNSYIIEKDGKSLVSYKNFGYSNTEDELR